MTTRTSYVRSMHCTRLPLLEPHVTVAEQSNDRVARGYQPYPHPTVALGQIAVLCAAAAAHLLRLLCSSGSLQVCLVDSQAGGRVSGPGCTQGKKPPWPQLQGFAREPVTLGARAMGEWGVCHLRARRGSWSLGHGAGIPARPGPDRACGPLEHWEPLELRVPPTPPSSARRQASACPFSPCLHNTGRAA